MDKELILEIPSNHTEAAIVSFSFFINETTLNWNELYFGVETGFLTLQHVVEKAEMEASTQQDVPESVLEASFLLKDEEDEIEKALQNLIKQGVIVKQCLEDVEFLQKCKRKFLYIIMLWLYQQNCESISVSNTTLYRLIWDFKGGFSDATYEFEHAVSKMDVDAAFLEVWAAYLKEEKELKRI